MPYGTILADTLQSSTAGTAPVFKDGGSAEIGQLCKAWVQFTGSGAATINASFNVSSVTYSTTGTYIVNFTTPFADAKYSAVVTAQGYPAVQDGGTAPTTSAYKFYVFYASSTGGGQTKIDSSYTSAAFFR